MGLFNQKFDRALSEDEALRRQEKPETIQSRCADVIFEFFFELLWANVLFVVFSIPLVTIPAAWCGLHRVVQQYFLHKPVSVFRTFWKEFTTDFVSRLGIVAALMACVGAGVWFAATKGTVVSLVVCAILVVAFFMIVGWLFPQLVLLQLPVRTVLRNAVLLMMIETKHNLLLVILHTVPLTLLVFLWPVSMLSALILPIVHVLLATLVTLPVLQARLVHEDENAEE